MGPPGPGTKGPLYSLFAKVAPAKPTPASDAIATNQASVAESTGAGESETRVGDNGKGKGKRERSVELETAGKGRPQVAGTSAGGAERAGNIAAETGMELDAVNALAKPASESATNLDDAIPLPQPHQDSSTRPSKRANQSTSLSHVPRPLSRSETKTSINSTTASQTDSITLDDSDDDEEVEMLQSSSTGSTRSLRNSTATQSLRSARLALKSNETTTKPTASYSLFNKPTVKASQEKKSKKDTEIIIEESTSRKKKAVPIPEVVVPYVPTAWSIGSFGSSSTASTRKKEAATALEAAWPTREQHGPPRISTSATAALRESSDRWVSPQSNGKGKGRAVEIEGEDYFNSLVQSFSTTFRNYSAPSVVTMTRAPQLVNHTRSSVPLLVPVHPPHPLLDRLSLPFKTTNPSPALFRRPHDRGSLTEYEGGAKEGVMWTTKYAPLSAKEVLGEVSGKSAGILKQWLGEVAVMSAEEIARDAKKDSKKRRRKIVREATRVSRKKRSTSTEFDDFLASDSEPDSDTNVLDTGYESNSSLGSSPFRPVSSRQNQSIFPNLTNLILLAGPKGTGKTCTAFAVAEEMGWDVFEVYTGMGRRGAKEIEGYVGEAGKNHTVWKAGEKGKGNPFAAAAALKKVLEVVEEQEGSKTRQSVILIEEIDVLYRDDKDFWPGVINLVKESKRPIIMTCNDYSLMPADDLPLQQIVYGQNTISFLPFVPPSPTLVIPFLQLVALHEGHLVPAASLTTLYSHEFAPLSNADRKSQTEQIPFPDNGDGIPAVEGDLRRSLNQLQFECQWAIGDSMGGVGWMDFSDEGEKEDKTAWSAGSFARGDEGAGEEVRVDLGGSLEDSVRSTDSISFCDAFVERRIEILLDDEPDAVAAEAEGEITFSVLTDLLRPARQQLPSYGIESLISTTLLSLLPAHQSPLTHAESNLYSTKRTATVSLANRLILEADLLDLPAPQLPSSTIFSDYLPFIRAICQTDDLRALADDQGIAGFGASKRSTRASVGRYVRRIEVRDARIYDEVGLSGFDLS